MLDKTEQSDQASSPNEKPESCYCSALPEGSGPCLPCYTRWLASRRSKGAMAEERPQPDPRLCRDPRGCDGSIRQELAAGIGRSLINAQIAAVMRLLRGVPEGQGQRPLPQRRSAPGGFLALDGASRPGDGALGGCAELSRNGLNSDSLPSLFGQRAGCPTAAVWEDHTGETMAKLLNEFGRGSKPAIPPSFTPCPLALADRDRREALRDQQSLTAAFFGDPLPGMSALDRRERERPH
jgi:hypothetical protein